MHGLEENRMRVFGFSVALAVVAALSIASQAQTYTCDQFTFFGPTNENGNSVPFGNAVNDSDAVVGSYQLYQTQYGFTRSSDSPFTKYLVPGSTGTTLGGINDNGEMVGSYTYIEDYNTLGRGFRVRSGGEFVSIDHPSATSTFATGVNNLEQVVGYYYSQQGTTQGFILSKGQFTNLIAPGATVTEPQAINDSGTVVGTWSGFNPQAFIYSGGTYTLETGPSGSGETFFQGINDNNDVAGYYLNTNVSPPVFQGFVYTGGTYYIVTIPNTTNVEVGGINNKGDISGGVTLTNGKQPAFLGTGCHF
jgi:hypothetical protein